MAAQEVLKRFTVEEFLEWELTQEGKYELYGGHAHAMAGASKVHLFITPVLSRICGNALQGKPCLYLDQDVQIAVNDLTVCYPDGCIACPPNVISETRGVIDNPKVIFEVLSPSTEANDRGQKFVDYRLLESLEDYVLISTKGPLVEVFSRATEGKWLLSTYLPGSVAHIPSVDIDIALDELYQNVTFA